RSSRTGCAPRTKPATWCSSWSAMTASWPTPTTRPPRSRRKRPPPSSWLNGPTRRAPRERGPSLCADRPVRLCRLRRLLRVLRKGRLDRLAVDIDALVARDRLAVDQRGGRGRHPGVGRDLVPLGDGSLVGVVVEARLPLVGVEVVERVREGVGVRPQVGV